jgi:hypothetical protein
MVVLRTSNSHGRSNVHFDCRFFWHLVPPQDFDRPIDCADDGVAIVCVCRGAVGAI